ncbi:hypothetical protein [Sphingomonas adhaesiva]|uniref:hypothetical protein n=1 Tax=Sphingomonas adhaesiva TaxID=28212 RepID=UPI002FFAC936
MPDVPATEGAVSEDVQEGSGSESEVGDTASQSTDVGSEYGDEDLGFTKEQLAGIKTGHNGDYTNKAILGRLLLSMEIKVHASTEAVFFEPVYIRYNAPISVLQNRSLCPPKFTCLLQRLRSSTSRRLEHHSPWHASTPAAARR